MLLHNWEIASRPDLTSQKENNPIGRGGNWLRTVQSIVVVIVGKRESRSGSPNNQIWVDMRSWRTHLTVNQAH